VTWENSICIADISTLGSAVYCMSDPETQYVKVSHSKHSSLSLEYSFLLGHRNDFLQSYSILLKEYTYFVDYYGIE
jgi:hypothetical protein